MEKLHMPNNIKVHFAGIEKACYAVPCFEMDIHYGLYTAFPFVYKTVFGKRVYPDIKMKWMEDSAKEMPHFICDNMKHVIQDSGLYSLLFGKYQDKGTKENVYRWYDAVVEFTLQHKAPVTVVEIDAQAIIGVEETWHLREMMRKDLPNSRIINVFHIEDGRSGLDRLIEYSDYLAIGSGVTNNGLYTFPLVQYIKKRKPDIDIHLLGCTKESVLKKCASICTSCDSITWLTQNRFGEFGDGTRIENLDTDKVRNFVGEKVWNNVTEYNGDKIAKATIVALEQHKRMYTKWCGNQN